MKFLFSLLVFLSVISSSYAASWTEQASMPQGKSDFHAHVIGDFVYIAGGCNADQPGDGCKSISGSVEIYNAKTNAWVTAVQPAMPNPRYRYSSAVVGNKIYYIGGRNIAEDVIDKIDVFDTDAKSWSTLPAQECLSCVAISDAAAFSIGTKIYVTGGYDRNYTVFNRTIVLDTSNATLQFRAGIAADKITALGDQNAVTIGTKAYLFGGFGDDSCLPKGTLEIYDSVTNSWTAGAAASVGRGDMAITVLNDRIFVLGGETKLNSLCNSSVPIDRVSQYNPSTNSWTELSLKLAIERFRFSSFVYGNKIYDIGGQLVLNVKGDFPITNKVYAVDASEYVASSAINVAARLSAFISLLLVFLW